MNRKSILKVHGIICLIVFIIFSIISEVYFSNIYQSITIIEDNRIVGEVRGDIEFIGDGIVNITTSHSIIGMNWTVNVTNLEKIVIEEGSDNEKIMLTNNVTIVPLDENIESALNLHIYYLNDDISNINGTIIYNKIESQYEGYGIDLNFHVKESEIIAELHSKDKLWVDNVAIKTDKSNIEIKSDYGDSINLYGNNTMHLILFSSEGSKFSISPQYSDFPDLIDLSGKLIINNFDGLISYGGNLFYSNKITIKSEHITVFTLEHPYSGSTLGGGGFGYAEDPQYWKIEILFEDGSFNIDGWKIRNWMIGVIVSIIPITIILIIGYARFKLPYYDKKQKKKYRYWTIHPKPPSSDK